MAKKPMGKRLTELTTHLSQMGTSTYVVRYVPAIGRYLLGILRDEDAAEEVTMEVCGLLLDKEEKQWQPEAGRFRDYLKGLVRRAADRWKQKQGRIRRK